MMMMMIDDDDSMMLHHYYRRLCCKHDGDRALLLKPASKSEEFLLKVRRLFTFLSTATQPCSRQRVEIFFRRRHTGFDFDDKSMFFSTTSDTNKSRACLLLQVVLPANEHVGLSLYVHKIDN